MLTYENEGLEMQTCEDQFLAKKSPRMLTAERMIGNRNINDVLLFNISIYSGNDVYMAAPPLVRTIKTPFYHTSRIPCLDPLCSNITIHSNDNQ
jgi:hypothetical protein